MKQLRNFLFIIIAVFSISALGEPPRVKLVACKIQGDTVTIGGLRAKLSAPINRNHLNGVCYQITYGERRFISVQYNGFDYISHEVRGVRMHDVYQLSDGQLTAQFSDPVESYKATWLEFRGYLVMRNMEKGLGADGYVYLSDSEKFVDFGRYASKNHWPVD